MDFNTGAAQLEIQSVVSSEDSAQQGDRPPLSLEQGSLVFARSTEIVFQIEQGPFVFARSTEIVLQIKDPPAINQSPAKSKRKSLITAAVSLFTASLTLMWQVLGRPDVLRGTVFYNVFLVTVMLALTVSLAVSVILARDLQMSGKVAQSMEIILGLAVACFLFALLAAGFVVMIPAVNWIVVCFVGVGAMVAAMQIYRHWQRKS